MDRQRRGKDEGGQIGEETRGKRTHFLRSPLARGHGAMGQTAASLPTQKCQCGITSSYRHTHSNFKKC